VTAPGVRGSVVVPAHDEASVLAANLGPLSALARSGEVQLVVVANGCSDDTAAVARRLPGVRVLELDEPSKPAALNAAERLVDAFPRVYLDADVALPPATLEALLSALADDSLPAARPPCAHETAGASRLVRAYHRARARCPSTSAALWGAGVYGLSAAGRTRFGPFPDLLADDLFVDSLFSAEEKAVVPSPPVVVRAPRTLRGLRATLRRTYRGNRELAGLDPAGCRRGDGGRRVARELAAGARSPGAVLDAAVYAGLVLLGRVDARLPGARWDRDDSSRQGVAAP
jgi:glycosyltransferase involved in cell wall biosynthesis